MIVFVDSFCCPLAEGYFLPPAHFSKAWNRFLAPAHFFKHPKSFSYAQLRSKWWEFFVADRVERGYASGHLSDLPPSTLPGSTEQAVVPEHTTNRPLNEAQPSTSGGTGGQSAQEALSNLLEALGRRPTNQKDVVMLLGKSHLLIIFKIIRVLKNKIVHLAHSYRRPLVFRNRRSSLRQSSKGS